MFVLKTRMVTFKLSFVLLGVSCTTAMAARPYPIEWQTLVAIGGTAAGTGVATDAFGNVFVTGYENSDPLPPSLRLTEAYLSKFDSLGTLLWKRQIGTTNWDRSNSVAVDATGNAYISGYTQGNLGAANAGGADAFLTKINPMGSILWSAQLGTSKNEKSNGVAIDRFGSIYITGYTEGGLNGPNAGGYDAFLAKFDSSGAIEWTQQIGTTRYEESNAVATDEAGNVYISGWTTVGAFLTKFDSLGNSLWTRNFGTSSIDRSNSVAVDQFDNVYISGVTQGTIGHRVAGYVDAFLMKLDSSGNELWTRLLGTIGPDSSSSVALDARGNALITGRINNDPMGYSINTDVFLAKYDALGHRVWTQQIGSNRADYSLSATVDVRGNVYISGYTEGNLVGSYGGFLIKFMNPVPEPCSALLCVVGVCCVMSRRVVWLRFM